MTRFQVSCPCQVFTNMAWGKPVPTTKKLEKPGAWIVAWVRDWSTRSAVGTVLPIWFPPKSTFRRLNPTRASLTMWVVRFLVQLTSMAWLRAVTLMGYPRTAWPPSRLKLFPRLNRYRAVILLLPNWKSFLANQSKPWNGVERLRLSP